MCVRTRGGKKERKYILRVPVHSCLASDSTRRKPAEAAASFFHANSRLDLLRSRRRSRLGRSPPQSPPVRVRRHGLRGPLLLVVAVPHAPTHHRGGSTAATTAGTRRKKSWRTSDEIVPKAKVASVVLHGLRICLCPSKDTQFDIKIPAVLSTIQLYKSILFRS